MNRGEDNNVHKKKLVAKKSERLFVSPYFIVYMYLNLINYTCGI